jgi:hypothetical protein
MIAHYMSFVKEQYIVEYGYAILNCYCQFAPVYRVNKG